jgi:hypothetical protein
MKILKNIAIVLFVIIAVVVALSFFLPSKVHVERTAVIKASPEAIFSQLNNLKNWNYWMPWNKIDPEIKQTFGAITEGKGASYSWESKNSNVGIGSNTITNSVPYSLIETDLNFMENGVAKGAYKLEVVEGGTKVIWSMDSDMGMNPIGKYFGLFMDKMVGPDFEKGLKDLEIVSIKTDDEMKAASQIMEPNVLVTDSNVIAK